MRRKNVILLVVIAAIAAGMAAMPYLGFFMLTGHFTPVIQIETLQNAVSVKGWNPDGLILADGRTLPLPGVHGLPTNSEALLETTKRGIEVGTNGQVWGLVRIYHWRGNDPVRKHITRINLSDMMTFLRVGEPNAPVPKAESIIKEPGGRFDEEGWRIEEYLDFQKWKDAKNFAP